MKYKLKVYAIWEYGQRTDANGNPHQEDCTFPLPKDIKDTDRLFILCDGMGGHDAGEVASATVCEAMGLSILKSQPDIEGDFTNEMLQRAIADAFDALDKKDTGAAKKMGTTMTFLKLHNRGCTIAHMGDSRVYHIRPGKDANDTRILFQTKDHSLVNDLIAIGELTEEEAKHSRQKNVITRAMQPHMENRPKADVYTSADIRPGDYFYLCSDGMLENMENPQICYNFSEAAGTDEEKVNRLTQATIENRDNHTAIIVHILEVINPINQAGNPTPGKAAVTATHIMAEVHDEEKKVQPISEKSNAAEAKVPSKLVQTNHRLYYALITLTTLIAAFAIAFYLSITDKGKNKEQAEQNNPVRIEQQKEEKREAEATSPVQPIPSAKEDTASPNQTEESEPIPQAIVTLPTDPPALDEPEPIESDENEIKEVIEGTAL